MFFKKKEKESDSQKLHSAQRELDEHSKNQGGLFFTNSDGKESLTIDGSWNIGTKSPETKLDVEDKALRFNEGKPEYGYLPLDTLDGAARVMSYGKNKYSKGNFRKHYEDEMSPLHSLIRHVAALQRAMESDDKDGTKGFLNDKESGLAHIHHVLTSAMILVQSMRNHDYDI